MAFIWGITLFFRSNSPENPSKSSHFSYPYFLILTPLLLTLQINLQVMCLIVFTMLLILFKIIPRPSILTLVCSQIPAAFTFMPWVLYKYGFTKLDEPFWNYTHPITQSIEFHPSYILDAPHLLLRLLSFVSGDTWNRFGQGFLHSHPAIMPFVLLGEIASFALVLIAVTFYFSKTRWRIVGEVFLLKNSLKGLSLCDKLDFICITLPLLLMLLSLFSITPLGVHSLLCLNFVGYYVFFRRVQELQLLPFLQQKKIMIPYLFLTVSSSVAGGASFRPNYHLIHTFAPYSCKGMSIEEALPLVHMSIPEGEMDLKGRIASTSQLLCHYFIE